MALAYNPSTAGVLTSAPANVNDVTFDLAGKKIYVKGETFDCSEEIIIGTQTATTASWTGVSRDYSLYDGKRIIYWLPRTSATEVTLNLTLADGSETGAIACYYSGSTRINTHYAAGNAIRLIYRVGASVNGTAYTGWWADANYDSGNTTGLLNTANIKAETACTAGNLIVGDSDGYHHLKTGEAFDINYPIYYLTNSISAGSTGNWRAYMAYPFTITTTQSITLIAYKEAFIKGTLSGTTFTPASTAPITQTRPTSADGYIYMLLGVATSTTQLFLQPHHPIYHFYNGVFQEYNVHHSSTTAKTAYGSTATTASANGGSITVTDIQYDQFGHVTNSTDRTIKLSQTTYTSLKNPYALTIKYNNGTTEGTNLFTYDGSAAKSINITPSAIGAAPTSHASPNTTYGVGTTSNYGHVKISNGDVASVSTADGLAAGMDHTHSNYVNQNAFSKVAIGDSTIEADSTTDTLTLAAGTNVTITPDSTNDKITIAATNTTYSAGTGLALSGTTFDHKNSVTAGTAGTSSATSGSTLAVPYITYDAQGHITEVGTHTHTISGFATSNTSHAHTVGDGLVISGSGGTSGTTTYSLDTSGATSGSYGPSAAVTGSNGTKVNIPYITVDKYGRITDIENIVYTSVNTTYSAATTSAAGLMSAADKSKLDGITASADSVSFTQGLTSGTEVGTITINGTDTKVYCSTNTDKAITAVASTSGTKYYLLGASSTSNQQPRYNSNISFTDGVLTATSFVGNLTGNVTGTASTASKLSNTEAIGSTTQPVYFTSSGVPAACTYSLNKTVPSDAVFTDTKCTSATINTATASDPTSNTVSVVSNAKVSLSGTGTALTGSFTAVNVPTKTYVDNSISSAISSVFKYKGTLGTGGTVTALPITGVSIGDAYQVTTAGTYASQACEVGDVIIATSTTPTWIVVQANWSVADGTATLAWGKTVTLATVGGVTIDATLPSNPNSDTRVTQTPTTTNASYPLLLAPSGQTAETTTTSYFDSGVTLNPSTNTIVANISGTAPKWATARTFKLADNDSTNTGTGVSVDGSADVTLKLPATIKATLTGNASTATKLAASKTINGTAFDGSSNITTANWGTARTITIGNTGKSVNGSAAVSWSLSEIGAAASSHTHSYLPLSGGTLTGTTTINTSDSSQFVVRRGANTDETTTMYQSDNGLCIDVLNDKTSAGIYFNLQALDDETNAGASAHTATASLVSSSTQGSIMTADVFKGTLNGNAYTATKLATSRKISCTGDATGSASFDGSADASIALTLANSGVTASSYGPSANVSATHGGTFKVPYITVDAKGRLTAASTKTITLPSDNNTTYTLSGKISDNTFVTTLTPSSGSATTAPIPAMGAASSSAAGSAGLVPAPAKGNNTQFLRGDGTWATPTDITGNAATATKLGTTTVGGSTVPIYLNSGTATKCSTYAGGTAVKLNGTSKAASTADFYAPTTSGTANQVLVSGGSETAPSWVNQSTLSVGSASTATTASKLGTTDLGGALQPIYLKAGVATAGTSYEGAITGITRSGTTFTYTCLDGTTGTFTQQDSNTIPSAYCSTDATTAAKTASCTGYVLLSKSYLHVLITTSNTVASALTLNVNSKGAKPIYINGAASSANNYTLPAGTYIVYYDGTNYYFRTDGILTASIIGGVTATSRATFLKGYQVHSAHGTSSTSGYVQVATFKISAAYQNQPIYLEVAQRGLLFSTLEIRFNNANSTDLTIHSFYKTGGITAYIYKSDTSTWDLYIKKSDSYDTINILDYKQSSYLEGVSVTWTDVMGDTTVPSGATEATLLPSAQNTWRAIQTNGTQIASTSVAYALNFANGNMITVSGTAGSSSAANKIVINHNTVTTTANTSAETATHGGTFTCIDGITTDDYGHVTAKNTKIVTLPTYSNATTSAAGLMSTTDKAKLNYTNIAYGTCSTAAATAAKVISISGNSNWDLTAGSVIVIKFSYTNTASNPTFNVNSKGAKSVWYNTALITTSNLAYAGTASRPMEFMYDGTQFVFLGWSIDNNTTYSIVTSSANGLVPMFDAADGTIDSASTDWVLTNNNGSIGWYKLPANAFNNDNTKVNVTLATTTKAYLLGTSSTPTSTATGVTAVADTGVYLDTTAGTLTATTFKGALSGNADSATKADALTTARTIAISGGATGTATSFNGSANITIPVTQVDASYVTGYLGRKSIYYAHHPEYGVPAVIPFLYNDLAFLTSRSTSSATYSVSMYSTTDTDYTQPTLTAVKTYSPSVNIFDGSPSYYQYTVEATSTVIVIDFVIPTFAHTTQFYIDFGATNWGAKSIKVYTWSSSSTNSSQVYTLKGSTTAAGGQYMTSFSYSYTNTSGTTVQGFDRLRVVLTDFNGTSPRIAQIGLINFGSAGVRNTYMSRGIDDALYRSLTPFKTNTYSLGSSTNMWSAIYGSALVTSTITLSNTITRILSAASTTPMIFVGSNNYDHTILRVNRGTSSELLGNYGYSLKYIGTGSGVANYLNLYADNQTATTQVTAISVNNSGQVGIKTNANASYSLYVSGDTYISGTIGANNKVTATGFIHSSVKSDDYVLLGNGGTKKLSEINGTVTSVNLSVPTGFSVTGNPITTSGTLTLSFASGYSLPTTTKQSNWDTAYGWGNHADAGYTKNTGTITGVIAGNGLTGGGTSGSVTLNVGAGTGISVSADVVSLSTATTSAIGGIKVAKDNSSYTVATNTSSISANVTSGKYYGIEIDSTDKAFVYVPWTDTDTKVTSVSNHYTPSSGTVTTLTNSNNVLSFGSTVITGITRDAAGHITAVTTSTLPSNPNTHYTAYLYLTNSSGTSNVTSATSNPYLTLVENSTARSRVQVSGTSPIVASGNSGVLTLSHATSGAKAGSYGESEELDLKSGSQFWIPYITVNNTGHITAISATAMNMPTITDTKNTAGAGAKTATKMYLVGATSQTDGIQTYSNVNCYVGTDNCLYSNGSKVLTSYTDTNTWRAIYVDSSSLAGTGTGTYALNFISGTGISLTKTAGSSSAANKITVSLSTSGATAGTYGTSSNINVSSNILYLPKITVDTYGRVTAIEDQEVIVDVGTTISSTTDTTAAALLKSISISGQTITATKCTATVGTATKPIYLSTGVPTACSSYAGGTAVTLNGTSKAASTASFYAPTSVGTSGYFLKSNGSGAPTWSTITTITTAEVTLGTTKYYLLGVTGATNQQPKYSTYSYMNSSGMFWTSDRRYKTNITNPEWNGMLNDYTGLIRKFDWLETGDPSCGYIAQELMEYVPEAVDYDEEHDKYSVNYNVAHSAAIAQLCIKIKELESEIAKLKCGIN